MQFLLPYENIAIRNPPNSDEADTIVDYLIVAIIDLYFDCLKSDNNHTEEAEDYELLDKMILQNFSTEKTLSGIMNDSLTLRYHERDIYTFLERSNKVYSHAQNGDYVKIEVLENDIHEYQNFRNFLLFRGTKDYKSIKEECLK